MTQQNFWTSVVLDSNIFDECLVVLFTDFLKKKFQCGKYNYQCNHLVVAPLFSSRLYQIFLHVSISILHRNRTHRTSSSTYYYVLVRILKRVGSFSTKYFSMCVCWSLCKQPTVIPWRKPNAPQKLLLQATAGQQPGYKMPGGPCQPGNTIQSDGGKSGYVCMYNILGCGSSGFLP